MNAIYWTGLAALLLAVAQEAPKKPDAKEVGKIIGTWTIISGEKNGRKDPEERIKGTTVRITKDAITVTDKTDKQTYKTGYRLSTANTPWAITMTVSEGPMKGQVAQGIMELKGDTLKLCYALPGKKAPTDFATKRDSGELLFVMKRGR